MFKTNTSHDSEQLLMGQSQNVSLTGSVETTSAGNENKEAVIKLGKNDTLANSQILFSYILVEKTHFLFPQTLIILSNAACRTTVHYLLNENKRLGKHAANSKKREK